MKKHRGFYLLLALFPASVLGCTAPTKTDFVGTWILTTDSRDALPTQFRDTEAELVLRADGSFSVRDFPLDVEWFGVAPPLTGSGVWRLGRGERWEHWMVLHFQSSDGEDADFGYKMQVSSSIFGQSLYFFWEDVDQGNRVTLRKETSSCTAPTDGARNGAHRTNDG